MMRNAFEKEALHCGPCGSVIIALTKCCPHLCSICAVDAVHTASITGGGDDSSELAIFVTLIRDIASTMNVAVDFSGGDPLCYPAWPEVFTEAAHKLGRERVAVSTTGSLIDDQAIAYLEDTVSEVDFTVEAMKMDPCLGGRSNGYCAAAWDALERTRGCSFRRGVSIVLRQSLPRTRDHAARLYASLVDVGVSSILLMGLSPVGRASHRRDDVLTPDDALAAIGQFQAVASSDGPEVRVQRLYQPLLGQEVACGGADHLYVAPDGLVSACPWALDGQGNPLASFVVGDLRHERFHEIYQRAQDETVGAGWDCSLVECALIPGPVTRAGYSAHEIAISAAG